MFKTFLSFFMSFIAGMVLFGGLYGLSSLFKSDPLVIFAAIVLAVATVSVVIIERSNKESAYQKREKKE